MGHCKRMSLVSIITLTFNKLAVTRRCLTGLLHTDHPAWELIVVENGSTDGTREWLETFRQEATRAGVRVTILAQPKNVGCSTARNIGIAAAGGEKIVFVDNDVTVRSRNWLARLEAVLDSGAGVAVVGPKLLYPFEPYPIQFAGGAVTRSGKVQFVGRGELRDDPRFNTPREVQYLISACYMTTRAVLAEVGGFDEAFNPVQFEDTDWCYRARSKGYRIWYEPSVEMYHFESTTTAGTATIPNTALVIRHGLLFKQRWKSMFEKEEGPPDEATAWRKVVIPSLESIPEPPVV